MTLFIFTVILGMGLMPAAAFARYSQFAHYSEDITKFRSKWKQTVAFATGYVNNTADAD